MLETATQTLRVVTDVTTSSLLTRGVPPETVASLDAQVRDAAQVVAKANEGVKIAKRLRPSLEAAKLEEVRLQVRDDLAEIREIYEAQYGRRRRPDAATFSGRRYCGHPQSPWRLFGRSFVKARFGPPFEA